MRKALATGLALAGFVAAASAAVEEWHDADEIAGTKTFWVAVPAADFEAYTNENYLRLRCDPDGRMNVDWHRGGRHSGWWVLRSAAPVVRIEYRFDSEDPEVFRFHDVGGIAAEGVLKEANRRDAWRRRFIEGLARHNMLVMKTPHDRGTTRFSLAGVTRALSKGFRRQCLSGAE